MRVGREDRLYGSLRLSVSEEGPYGEWAVVSGRFDLQIPLFGPFYSVSTIQSSASGYTVYETGARTRLWGKDRPGSVYLTVLAGVTDLTREETDFVSGWHVGLGGEVRY